MIPDTVLDELLQGSIDLSDTSMPTESVYTLDSTILETASGVTSTLLATRTATSTSSWPGLEDLGMTSDNPFLPTQSPTCSCERFSQSSFWPGAIVNDAFSDFSSLETAVAYGTFDSNVPLTTSTSSTTRLKYYIFSMTDDLRSLPPEQLASGIPIEVKMNQISARDAEPATAKPTPSPSSGVLGTNTSTVRQVGFPPQGLPLAFSNKSPGERSVKRMLYSVLSNPIFNLIAYYIVEQSSWSISR